MKVHWMANNNRVRLADNATVPAKDDLRDDARQAKEAQLNCYDGEHFMLTYTRQAELSAMMLRTSAAWAALVEAGHGVDDDLLDMILGQAAVQAEEAIAPLNADSDRIGARLVDGRVICPPGYKEAWNAYAEAGWIAADLPEDSHGQGLPVAVQAAAQMLFDRACPAFVMVCGATRSAAFVLRKFGTEAMREEWVPRLASGEWSSTICISEPDAGSDVGRIRTRAEPDGERWKITGQKCWISFGDHDLTDRIGHLLLARTPGAAPGTRGLSLFLVPSVREDGARNEITIERIEEKLGLHGSPTCVMRFDDAEGMLIGQEGRGLAQLFVMIERMRLLTAGQGAGAASAAAEIANRYAHERRQGGRPDEPPVTIVKHPDVRRQLYAVESDTLIALAFTLELAVLMDLAEATGDAEITSLVAWMLPLAKNFGAEAGFSAASGAIQILGGAGYTREWPAEQILRDTRILSIFEGTTGMQALDLLHRRLWAEEGKGLAAFLARLEEEARLAEPALAGHARSVAADLEKLAADFNGLRDDRARAEAGADSFLRAAWAGCRVWMALRLIRVGAAFAGGFAMPLDRLGAFAVEAAIADMAGHRVRAEQLARLTPAEK